MWRPHHALVGTALLLTGCAAALSWDFSGDPPPSREDAGAGGSRDASKIDASVVDAKVVDAPITPPDAEAGGPITFVQSSSAALDVESVSSLTVPLTKAQVEGDLVVVAIGWYGTSPQVISVTDTSGNSYAAAGAPVSLPGANSLTQVIRFAAGIRAAAAGNVIKIDWDGMADGPDVRIAEFSGLDRRNPLGTTAMRTGVSTSPASGPLTTQVARSLLFSAATVHGDITAGDPAFPGVLITTDTNLAQWRIVDAAGTYTATSTQKADPELEWVMQSASFH